MEKLPPELHTRICHYINAEHHPSLISLALTSKQYYDAATKERFRNIRITVKDAKSLASDVTDCLQVLKASAGLKHVRNLKILGTMRLTSPSGGNNLHQNQLSRPLSLPWQDLEDPFAENWIKQAHDHSSRSEDGDWSPLATLIQQLPGLVVVEFTCDDQLPSCILHALRSHTNQRIKLRLNSASTHELVRQDRAMLDSPLLNCLTLHRNEKIDLEETLSGSLLKEIPPKLKEIRVIYDHMSREAFSPRCSPWFEPGSPRVNGTLEILRIHSPNRATPNRASGFDLLRPWFAWTDHSLLKVLDLRCYFNNAELAMLMTVKNSFSALTDLYIKHEICTPDQARSDPDWNRQEIFLLSPKLPPLQGLNICGIPQCFFLLLDHHGPALRRLHFRPVKDRYRVEEDAFNLKKIELIRNLCPNLQHLSFHLRRTEGDAQEIAMCQLLGSMKNLISVGLIFDISSVPDDNGYVRQPSPSSLHPSEVVFNAEKCEKFRNSVLDVDLACSIFRTITSSKAPESAPLQMLKIKLSSGGRFGEIFSLTGIDHTFDDMVHYWMITRSPRDDQPGFLIASEVNPRHKSDE